MNTETRSLTIIPTNRTTNKGPSPNTHRDKEAADGGSDDRNDYNGVLLSHVDNHCGRWWGQISFAKLSPEVGNGGWHFQSGGLDTYDHDRPAKMNKR